MKDESYKEYILDLLDDWEGIYMKRMFGGWGLFHNDMILGLIFDNELYLKVDDSSKAEYKARGSRPFTYKRGGKEVALSYWLVPEEVLEDRGVFLEWALQSLEINDIKLKAQNPKLKPPKQKS